MTLEMETKRDNPLFDFKIYTHLKDFFVISCKKKINLNNDEKFF